VVVAASPIDVVCEQLGVAAAGLLGWLERSAADARSYYAAAAAAAAVLTEL